MRRYLLLAVLLLAACYAWRSDDNAVFERLGNNDKSLKRPLVAAETPTVGRNQTVNETSNFAATETNHKKMLGVLLPYTQPQFISGIPQRAAAADDDANTSGNNDTPGKPLCSLLHADGTAPMLGEWLPSTLDEDTEWQAFDKGYHRNSTCSVGSLMLLHMYRFV
jgi:hypothetical protein